MLKQRTIWRLLTISLAALAIGLGGLASVAFKAQTAAKVADQSAVHTINLNSNGIAASFTNLSAAQLSAQMAAIRSTGAKWVRFDLNWSEVQQSGPRSYNWTNIDRIVAAARNAGLDIDLAIGLTPPWARVAGCTSGERCAPAHASDFVAFSDAAANHFGTDKIAAWEIWNEPNIAYRFAPATDPAKYVAMLKQSNAAIKAVDSDAIIIGGNMAPASSGNGDLRPDDFLAAMYAEGAAGSFDALSIHPYTYPLTPSQSHPLDAWGQMLMMHQTMANHDDGKKLIWVTEFGAPTSGRGGTSDVYVSEDVQATTMSEAARILRSQSWSGPLFWYNWQDGKGASSEDHYGLLRADGSHKPAYDAFIAASK